MARRVRPPVDGGLRPRQPNKNNSTIIALIVFVLLALLFLSRTRQVTIPQQQAAFGQH